ncbi:MAG: dTDP-4-amino-4,6-dideoxygalactose transaminase [Nocardioidaceae bacterium]|jgi:dTDP-4-amino-4,6-dideoxygalactose transaminase|nr:dTDP-4-amino-4,6-dideoxygalactose transaminase [Nocardioidaceae bacterium]
MPSSDIPFNRACVEGAELEYIRQAVDSGHMSTSGPFSKRSIEMLLEWSGAEEVLLTTSCTSALELTSLMLDLRPGDSVIVPSFTFTTTALAFARQGAKLLFCDIEPETLGLDARHLATLLDDTVRAVVPVHYAGVACDVDGIRKALAGRPDVAVIEDNAHGLFASWHDQPLGSLGRFSTLSFHETKNINCGEGGALVLNDARDVDRARVLYDKGTNRRAFFLGQVDKYSWKDTGSSFGLSDILAAYLCAQLEKSEAIQAKRRDVYERYERALAPLADELELRLPVVPDSCRIAYHMFYLLLKDRPTRDSVLAKMRGDGIQATFHYVPLHSSDAGRRFSAVETECPVTDDVSGRLIRLPFYNNLTDADSERVVESFLRALAAAA